MDRHEAARQARAEFREFLERVKRDFGIERKRIALLLGVSDTHVSRMAAAQVARQPTFSPPADWRRRLAPHLAAMGDRMHALAKEMEPPA